MKELCERARAAMNLMLVMALVQIWASNGYDVTPNRVRAHVQQIYGRLAGLNNPHHAKPPAVKALEEFFSTGFAAQDAQEAQLRVPLSLFNDMPIEDVRFRVKSSKAELEELAKDQKQAGLDDKAIAAQRVYYESYDGEAEARLLEEMKGYIFDSGLSPTATTGDLMRFYRRTIRIPFVEHDIGVSAASLLIGLAEIGPAFYLLSVMSNILMMIRSRKRNEEQFTSFDLVLLYRGELADVLGIMWLATPVVSMYVAISALSTVVVGLCYAVFLAVPLGFVLAKTYSIRKAAFGDPSRATRKKPQDYWR